MSDPLITRAALAALGLLQAVMLAALLAGLPPHPPQAVTPFAMGPFLGTALAVTWAAWLLVDRPGAGRVLALATCAVALVSFGPQKWLDPAFPAIWPAVICAQIGIATLLWQAFSRQTTRQATA